MTKFPLPFLLIALAGSAPAAPVPDEAKAPVMFFPTTPVTWVYECHGAGNEPVREVVRAVTAVTEQGGAKVVAIGTVEGRWVTSGAGAMAVSSRGLVSGYMTRSGGFDPDATLLRTPAVAGERWTVVRRTSGGVQETRFTTRGPEEVVVPAGRFQAVAVDISCVVEGGPSWRERAWFAPGVGVVRWDFDHGRFHVLKRLIRGTQWEIALPREVQP
ncbi:hypothetical protein J0H58_19550 [bacterium]|nr:hypothetical protein [bacterium]